MELFIEIETGVTERRNMPITFLRGVGFRDAFWALLVLGIAILMLDFPNVVAGDDLDLSWGQALGYFASHRWQAGVDYIFTYGPLGYFSTENYDPALFVWAFWWNVIIAMIFALAVVRMARFSTGLLSAFVFAAVVVAVDFPTPGNKEDFFRTLMLAMALPLLRPARASRTMLVISVMVIAVIAQVKFTYAVLAILAIVCCELRYRFESVRSIASPLPLFIPAFCLTWMLAGQRLWNIPTYLYASFQVSSGYLAAMGSSNPDPFHITPVAVILLLLLLIAAILHCQSNGISPRTSAITFLLLANAWLAWKHAVTRADSGHLILLLGLLAILFLLLPIMLPANAMDGMSRLKIAVAVVSLLLCAYGTVRLIAADGIPWSLASVKANLDVITSPSQYKARMENERAGLARQFALPKIRSIVGSHTADVISFEQGVLLLNQLNYQPRPIFQSYQTNTHFLIHTNGQFFASDRAADYVLFKGEPIDNRLPAIEDSEALLQLANRYAPVVVENGFCLLKRLERARGPLSPESTVRRTVSWNSVMNLPDPGDGYQTLSLKIKPSLRGRAESFLYKEPEVYAVLRLSTGQAFSFRIVPVMSEDEFFLNPLLVDNLWPLYLPGAGQKIASLFFTTKEPACFADQIDFELKTYHRTIDPAEADRLRSLMASPRKIGGSGSPG